MSRTLSAAKSRASWARGWRVWAVRQAHEGQVLGIGEIQGVYAVLQEGRRITDLWS